MIRSRYATGEERRAAAMRDPGRLNPVERMMGTLELLLAEWDVPPPAEPKLELAAQALLRDALTRPFSRDVGQKVVGLDAAGRPIAVRFGHDTVELSGPVPLHLLRDLLLRILG